ncbi:MAG: MMPL family transporter [Pirellulaceae bacterium]
MKEQSFASRRVVWVLVLAAFLLPLTFVGARRAVESNANDVEDWLPTHYAETSQFRSFQKHFGNDDFVVVSWPGCTLDDPRLDRYAELLRDRRVRRVATGEVALFEQVITGRELLAQLTAEPTVLSRREVVTRLRGAVIGPDGEQTCAVVTLRKPSRDELHAALQELSDAALAVGLSAEQVHLGGPPVVNAAIDRASTQSLVRLASLAGLIGLLVAWVCFRTVRLTVIVFIVATYSAALSLAVVPLFGVPLNAILVTMVPLVYVAAMSGAIHLSNYYLDSRRAGERDPIAHALKHAIVPLGLATGTTAVGLLSLEFSDIAPIRLFGLFSALGVWIGLVMQFVLLPALLAFWPDNSPLGPTVDTSADDDAPLLSPRWQRLASFVIGRQAWLSAGCLVLLVLGAWGLTKVETSIQIMRLFSPQTPIIASYAWLEQHLGALVPLEIVLRFDPEEQPNMAQRLALVESVQKQIATLPDVGGSLSAATFAPSLQSGSGRSLRSFMINRRLRQARPKLIESGYLAESDEGELWRISVRVNAVRDIDYSEFQRELQAAVDPLIASSPAAGKVEAIYTGAVPIIFKARHSLLDGLALGFGTDIALVVLAVALVLRHWSNGLLMLLASVFPMTLVFGLMGWSGTLVDIGSIMTPCVALGVTIDDVIHFVLWFRRGAERGLSVRDSVLLAYRGCGRAMVQSWGVIGLGLAAFSLSTFEPTFRFGALMIALLTVGLVGNLLFLPALLAGPLGRSIAASVQRRVAAKSRAKERAHQHAKQHDPSDASQPVAGY